MGKQRSLSNEEKTRIFAQHDHILIPAQKARELRELCHAADEFLREIEPFKIESKNINVAPLLSARRRLSSALDRTDFQYLLSVPGENPDDPAQ